MLVCLFQRQQGSVRTILQQMQAAFMQRQASRLPCWEATLLQPCNNSVSREVIAGVDEFIKLINQPAGPIFACIIRRVRDECLRRAYFGIAIASVPGAWRAASITRRRLRSGAGSEQAQAKCEQAQAKCEQQKAADGASSGGALGPMHGL
ncbi:hypothetical protein GCM10022278_00360 [Allohahella marinimesophila]|uniref:Uncharacterized protein n=1 Tax=Allohahella marinimesophila TaxID=1054972 RepID=A0ABP7NGJ6_9GAMM